MLQQDIQESRKYEMKTYIDSMRAMYDTALAQNGDVYDSAYALTNGFASVTAEAIVRDSRIIKILRYAIAPSISQMKFGQLFGLSSTEAFEARRIVSGNQLIRLRQIAPDMAGFISRNIDLTRFVWHGSPEHEHALARQFAKNWTCSIAADQNAQTAYRKWRKDQQELKIAEKLISYGYVRSKFRGIISLSTDLGIGEYTPETKVRGRTIQKADVALRSKSSKKLVLIEAKAVGVELDATKRVKECRDKASDWSSAADLASPEIVVVMAGFFSTQNIHSLLASGVSVVWEHRLTDLGRHT